MFVGESDYYSGIDNITNLGDQYSLDLEITQDLGTMQLTLGAENITDEYPDDDTELLVVVLYTLSLLH